MFNFGFKMIHRAIQVSFLIYFFAEVTLGVSTSDSTFNVAPERYRGAYEKGQKAVAGLNLGLHLLSNVRQNYQAALSSKSLPADCEEILRNGQNKSGVYTIFPWSKAVLNPIEVYCDMETEGGGWTVIQRRGNFLRPKDYFYQDWQAYKKGFGNIEKDFWLGNDNIFGLSNQRVYSVRFDLQDVEGNKRYALYDTFWTDDEYNGYRLHISDYSGNAGDSMLIQHNEQKFSTKDRRNDNQPGAASCAELYKGGWWYNRCHHSNLNGLYLRGVHESYADGVDWSSWKGYHESMEWTEIKIRSKDFRR